MTIFVLYNLYPYMYLNYSIYIQARILVIFPNFQYIIPSPLQSTDFLPFYPPTKLLEHLQELSVVKNQDY